MNDISSETIRQLTLDLIHQRGDGKTICPSEVARHLWPDDWRPQMANVRRIAGRMADRGEIVVRQRGMQVSLATAKGPIRLGKSGATVPSITSRTLRLGLCCQFTEFDCKFRTTTAAHLLSLTANERRQKLSEICLANARSLRRALEFCGKEGIGCFRILSTILPLKTHPRVGYVMNELPQSEEIIETFRDCGRFAQANDIRTVFHPDQFVVLNSPKPEVVQNAIRDLEYHAELCEWIGADVINIHGGGAYGDKSLALVQFARCVQSLPSSIRSRLTVENDDKTFTPADLLPLCQELKIPLVYDVHHHRCLSDGLTVEEATSRALATWNREPLFHLSSPLEGWNGPHPERHHDYIDHADFPTCWRDIPMTVEVEAKAKELAVLRLHRELNDRTTSRTIKRK
jgi:UV DNA damage endonuclease